MKNIIIALVLSIVLVTPAFAETSIDNLEHANVVAVEESPSQDSPRESSGGSSGSRSQRVMLLQIVGLLKAYIALLESR